MNLTNNDACREAVELLRRIRDLMKRRRRSAEFTRYVDELRVAHKAKRNFSGYWMDYDWRPTPP